MQLAFGTPEVSSIHGALGENRENVVLILGQFENFLSPKVCRYKRS